MIDALTDDDRALLDRVSHVADLARATQPDAPAPVFAWMRVETRGHLRDLALGFRAVTEGPLTVLHWQTAPLASVFFAHRPGEDYEVEVGDRTLEGTLRAKALLRFERGALAGVTTPDADFVCEGGRWSRAPSAPTPLTPRPAGASRAPSPFTLEALDPAQRSAVGLPQGRHMLVLGEAGCGKTTVALHRVAALYREAESRGQRLRALVLVPVEGLRRLSETLLARMGAEGVEVRSFDRWAGIAARRAFSTVPRRESRAAPASVARLKRHPALRAAMADAANREGRPAGATATREDLQHLFGDRALMERVVSASGGAIYPHAVEGVLAHTNVQFTATSEELFAHVDADRLKSIDGLSLDAGTPWEDAGAVDPEDYAVLFALAAMRETRRDRAPRAGAYDCVVIDEAQEFAPLELEMIGRALAPGGAIVVAGDEAQRVDPTACFEGWDETMRSLGVADFDRVRLAVNYRCPPEVTEAARAVLAGAPVRGGDRGAVVTRREPDACALVSDVVDALRAVRQHDPDAMVAVVCRTPEAARRTAALLSRGEDVSLVERGEFRFARGVEVTCVQEVKGLEFDHVLMPDCDAGAYPEGGESRRALYVAMTRASWQHSMAWVGSAAPALR